MGEPNDFPESAIVLPNPLPIDPPPTFMGSYYQICPDRTAPDVPDVDVYKFKLLTGVDNGCVELMSLAPGTYYAVVRGTVRPEEPGKYTMNDYRLRVFTVDPSGPGYSCSKKPDMGP